MKQRLTFIYLLVLIVICHALLTSCSAINEDSKNAEQPNTSTTAQTVCLHIQATSAIVENAVNVRSTLTAYKFEGKSMFPTLNMQDGEMIEGWCVIKNENANIPIVRVGTTWTWRKGKLWCKEINANVMIPANEPIKKWYVLHAFGEGIYNKVENTWTFDGGTLLTKIESNHKPMQWNIPYLSAWQEAKIKHNELHLTSVSFKPQGAFVRLRMKNNLQHTLHIKHIRMYGCDPNTAPKPFTTKGNINLNNTKNNLTYIDDDRQTVYSLPQELVLKPGKLSPWYGIWVMPMGKEHSYATDVFIEPQDIQTRSDSTPWWIYHTPLYGMSNAMGITNGKSYTLLMNLKKNVDTKLNNWMQDISNQQLICKMSIPGTHDTAADNPSGIQKDWVKTQDWNLKQQLENGIRFLDIRLVLKNGKLNLCHGSYTFTTEFAKDVLHVVRDFLKAHPSETVMMTIKKDDGGWQGFSEAVNNAINNDITLKPYIANEFNPSWTLGDVRGKMIPISREGWYTTCCGFIPSWPDNRPFESKIASPNGYQTAKMYVEDQYKAWENEKKDRVLTNITKANKAYNDKENAWFITFCSYTGPNGISHPWRITDGINRYIEGIITKPNTGWNTCGIVLYNFCNYYESAFTKAIIKLNGVKLDVK